MGLGSVVRARTRARARARARARGQGEGEGEGEGRGRGARARGEACLLDGALRHPERAAHISRGLTCDTITGALDVLTARAAALILARLILAQRPLPA